MDEIADAAQDSTTPLTALDKNNSSTTPAALVFGLTDRIPTFNYLVTTERVGWYRTIMRIFAQRHRELYKYQLTAQEIWEEVRHQFDPDYSLDKCHSDLRSLEEWGNLITTYDASRHTSIASFRSPALLYQATPLAITLENFLEEQRRTGSSAGALRQGDLAHLWEMLQRLDGLLRASQPEPRQLAEEWRRLFELFNTMAREAAQYLANMIATARQPRPDLEAYQTYKRSVVEYVTNFGQALAYYSLLFRNSLKEWFATDLHPILIEAVADFLHPPGVEQAKLPPRATLLREAGNQLNALAGWFAAGSNADIFRRAAATEVEKVVRRAEQLAAAARPNANYAVDLDGLARRIIAANQTEEAAQLTLVAFAHALPQHLPENLARPSGTTGMRPAWQEEPVVTPVLRDIGRARVDKTPEQPINVNREAELALVEERLRLRQEEEARFAALFAAGSLELAEIVLQSPAERNALLAAVRGCLRDNRHEYRAPDGSTIVLTNPQEKSYGLLRASDGSILMPRYRLVKKNWTEAEKQDGSRTLVEVRAGGQV